MTKSPTEVTNTATDTAATTGVCGFVPGLRSALFYAGAGGRIATLPDIIAARINTASESMPP